MTPTWESDGVQLYLGDCLEIMPQLPDGCVDAVITDPPYGINGGSGHINKQRGKGVYTDAFPDTPDYIRNTVVPVIRQCMMLCNCVVLTPGNKNFHILPAARFVRLLLSACGGGAASIR